MTATIVTVGQAANAAGERTVIDRLVAGDDAALAAVYDEHAAYVCGLARRVCRDRAMADDVTQDVFVHLWSHADTYDPTRASLRTWLGLLTHRRAIDRIRSEDARRRREDRDHRRALPTAAAIDDEVLRALATAPVAAALAALPAAQRRCVTLAYVEGLTFREVATELGIPEGTAKSRIRLGLAKLAASLAAET